MNGLHREVDIAEPADAAGLLAGTADRSDNARRDGCIGPVEPIRVTKG